MPLNAKTPYDHILTGIGLIEGGKISDAGKKAFIEDVILLLTLGNRDGKTLVPIASLFPLPPVGGPPFSNLNIINPELEPLFWFGPDPLAALQATTLLDENSTPFWHKIFIDILYTQTALALDLPGNTPLFPIFDVSAPFGIDLPIPFTLPDLAVKANIQPLPKLMIKLADLGIKVSVPSISIPSLNIPQPIELPPFPKLPELLLGLFELPFKLLISLLIPPKIDLAFDLPNLPKTIFGLAFDLLFELLKGLGLLEIPLLPKAFIASLLVYMKNVISMVCVDIIGNLVGVGSIALGVGIVLGLVTN